MFWRQTTLDGWLNRAPGSSVKNPIIIADDDELPLHPDVLRIQEHHSNTALNPILITDSEPESEEDDDNELPSYVPIGWPPTIRYWNYNRNPAKIRFPNMDLGKCACSFSCSSGKCANASSAVYCCPYNCDVGPACGNRLQDFVSLLIMPCIGGYGVWTAIDIPPGTVLGEYCGKIIPDSRLTTQRIRRGFVMEMKSRSKNGEPVFIDAAPGGSLCRFVNHSCSPNSKIEERAFRRTRKMVIVTEKNIFAGDEVTINYNHHVDFTCLCGEPNCISLVNHA